MRAFFEEYGFVMIAVVVVAVLIGITVTVGDGIETQITTMISDLATKASSYFPQG